MTNEKLSPIQEELLKRADSIFESISSAAQSGFTLAQEQLPDIAYQFISYSRMQLSIKMSLGVILFLVGLWLFVRVSIFDSFKQGTSEYCSDWAVGRCLTAFFGCIFILLGSIFIANLLQNFVLVWAAPKIYLIQYIVLLTKGVL